MRKYWAIFKISWQNTLVYRFNILMWRIRMMVAFLGIYFFWGAVFSQQVQFAGYSRPDMIGYLLIVFFLQYLVIGNDSFNIAMEIANGDLNNYLLKPLSYFSNWSARDWALKLLNLILCFAEATVLIIVFKLPVFTPNSLGTVFLFTAVAVLAAYLYFFFSFLFSSFSFWYPEHDGWPLRFLMLMFLEFFAGTAFPLDIFPQPITAVLKWLPTSYLIYFPAQIYLGRLGAGEIIQGLVIMLLWLGVLAWLSRVVWKKGLQIYGAYGR